MKPIQIIVLILVALSVIGLVIAYVLGKEELVTLLMILSICMLCICCALDDKYWDTPEL